MGSGMGGGGHANPTFMFQADYARTSGRCCHLGRHRFGIFVPFYCVWSAQKKAGTW